MRPPSLASRRANRGFTLFELILSIGLIGFAASTLYERVSYYRERAEMAAMVQTAAAMQSGLQFRVAAYLVNRQPQEILQLNYENPVNWLMEPPKNYAGALRGGQADTVEPGNWYYDVGDRAMVYVVKVRDHFEPGPDGFRVRYRANVEYGPILGADGRELAAAAIRKATFSPVRPYRWFVGQ